MNQRNKTNNRLITVFGRTITVAAAAEEFSVPYEVLIQRLMRLGWSHERAVTQKVRKLLRNH